MTTEAKVKAYADAALRKRKELDKSKGMPVVVAEAIKAQGITNPADVKRLTPLVLKELRSRAGKKAAASSRRRAKRAYYHLEAAAPGETAFFVFYATAVRIEFVSLGLKRAAFRVVYPQRSYEFSFMHGYPYDYPEPLHRKIRLSPETYRVLYRVATTLLSAVFCGVQPNYQHKKGRLRIETGEYFKLRSLLPSRCEIDVRGVRYEFRHDKGEYFFLGSIEGLSDGMLRFLHRFLPLAMAAYEPYERKPGDLLEPLPLYEGFETEPPRKVRQMRHQRAIDELTAQGKPPKLAKARELPKEVAPNLFEPKALRS